MTLVEFLNPLKGGVLRDICLSAMYFHQRYEGTSDLTVEGLRTLLKRGRVAKADRLNLADVLSRAAPLVHTAGKQGNRFLWALTSSGEDHVRSLLSLPKNDVEVENDVATLKSLISKISDNDLADYLDEGLKCLQVDALRATVVFVWSGAIKKIRDDVFACGATNVNSVLQKHDAKAKVVKKVDDLVLVKEATLLLASQDLGLFDKNQKSVLEECLNLRNKCGHPGKYKVGPKKVSSFIEDVVNIVLS